MNDTSAHPPRIVRVEPLRARGERVRLRLDGAEPFEVSLEALDRLGAGVGDPLPSDVRRRLLEADADVRVRDAALRLLAHRARTRAELHRRLLARGFAAMRVDGCLDRLAERGLLDDAAVAAAFVRDRLRHRPRAPARLASELRARGIDVEIAHDVVRHELADAGTTEDDLARDVARKWIARQPRTTLAALVHPERTPTSDRARRRLRGHLTRRGFGGAALVRAIELAVELARARVADPDP